MSPTTDTSNIGEALRWIVSLLQRRHIPYQVVGGLAAQAYGAQRPVADIDLYIPMEKAQAFLAEIEPYLTRKLGRHRSAYWDLVFLALNYRGVSIEIADSAANPLFYNPRQQRWEAQIIDYAASRQAQLYGVDVAVMPKDELLHYKALLDREVDRADIQAMTSPVPEAAPEEAGELSPYLALALDLSSFDARPYEALIATLEAEGFQFTSMEALGNTEEAQRKLYALNDSTAMETPGATGEHAWATFENFQEEVCQMRWYKPGGQIIAIDTASGDWAAMSAITRFTGEDFAYNLFTGVDRRYQGRKLAQAVLALALRYAHTALGAEQVRTEESKQNLPLIEVYREMGYGTIHPS